jgi:hypothetical protein
MIHLFEVAKLVSNYVVGIFSGQERYFVIKAQGSARGAASPARGLIANGNFLKGKIIEFIYFRHSFSYDATSFRLEFLILPLGV